MAPPLDTDESDFDPFAMMDTIIHTPDEAVFWLRFFAAVRGLALLPWDQWATDDRIRKIAHDDDELEFIQILREVARDPESLARGICAIDLWTVRTRLEWDIP